MAVVGQVTSTPDADGNHRLKCPVCDAEFAAVITKDDETGELQNITCEKCDHDGEPLVFVHAANKEASDKMVMSYAEQEIRKALKNSFGSSRNIKLK